MAYSRPPVQPGRALKRSPAIPIGTTAGVFDFKLDADIATTECLGVVQIGTGLSITPEGVLSATTGTAGYIVAVKLVSANYTFTSLDYVIISTKKDIELTLPVGILGRIYVIKNQSDGSIKVKGSLAQTIDSSSFKSLGSENYMMVVFDGTRWNVI